MHIVSSVGTLEQLAQRFTSLFEHRVFRLETLDYYDAENEREPFARFLAGEPVDPAWREPWKRLVREVRESGRVMQRVQVVSAPASNYVRFSLLHGKPANVEAGEDVRVLSRSPARAIRIPEADFWLFDDGLAAVLEYDASGAAGKVRLTSDHALLTRLLDARRFALEAATPLARYVAEHNLTERMHAA